MRVHRTRDLRHMQVQAVAHGATVERPRVVSWDVSGSCESPVTRAEEGRDPGSRKYSGLLILQARCRKCPACLRHRAWSWRNRMRAEHALSVRTWLVSLEFGPRNHDLLEKRVHELLRARRVLFWKLPEHEQFAALANGMYGTVQGFLKRLRQASPGRLRFVCVFEPHSKRVLDGKPHAHLLIHERDEQGTAWKTISQAWINPETNRYFGFMHAKLVPWDLDPTYIAKYLTKVQGAPVRASLRYGKDHLT